MIADSTIEAVKGRADIVSVIGDYLKLTKRGAEYVGLCPFHGEKTPSFKVHPAKQMFKCFGCGKSGDVFSFIMQHDKKTYPEAVEILSKKYNISLEQKGAPLAKKAYAKPVPRLQKVSDVTLAYFQKRGISNNTLLRFKIAESKEWMPKAQAEVTAISFPYFRNDELVTNKYRAKDKDFKLEKNTELIFFNLDSISGVDEITIVEGEIDCMSLYECGIYAVISVPNGTPPKGELKLEYLDNCWQWLEGKKKVILMTDNDEVGRMLRDELARRIGYEKCYQVTYPAGCKDANDVLVKHGRDEVIKAHANATEWPMEGIVTMFDMVDDIINFYENGYPNGFPIPLPGFGEKLQLMLGQYTTVTGIPGSGKSEMVDWIMVAMSMAYGWQWAVFSAENQPSSLHATKLIEKFAGKSFAFRKNPMHRIPRSQLGVCMEFIENHFHFININEMQVTMPALLKKIGELVFRKGVKGFLIDPWSRVEHKKEHSEGPLEYINRALTSLSSFCKTTTTHGILVAHPVKVQKDKKTGKYEVPTMYSISGSSDFYNFTDNGVTVWRDFDTGLVDVYRQKIRYGWLGEIGFSTYHYNRETRQYESADGEQSKLTPLGKQETGAKFFTNEISFPQLPPERDDLEELPF